MCYSADRKTMKALVTWENNPRPPQFLTFSFLASQNTIDLDICADPFLTACTPIAYRHGERRVLIEGNVCPFLVENIYTVLEYLRNWYWYEYNLIKTSPLDFKIEAHSFKLGDATSHAKSGCFFSGGADSFDLVLNNMEMFKADHELKIKQAIYIHGLDFGNRPKRGDEEDFFTNTRAQFKDPLDELDIELIPAWTNIRSLDKDTRGWQNETHGSAMSAVGQCLSSSLSNIWLAGSHPIPKLTPWGTHPMLDQRFSSSRVSICHYRERVTRLEKIQNISQSSAALDSLRVCFFGDNSTMNCGRCEKCIRTKIALLISGKLEQTKSMPIRKVSFKDILSNFSLSKNTAFLARECIGPLNDIDRTDLVLAIRLKLLQHSLKQLLNWKGFLKTLDKEIFGGRLKRQLSVMKVGARP